MVKHSFPYSCSVAFARRNALGRVGLRRVVITGMGAVSPNGIGRHAFAEAILAGTSGVRRISHFDPSELPVQIAGEVRDFDELAWVEKRERKHVSRVLPLALAAASEALNHAGLDEASLPLEERRRFAVILGSGGGSQEFTEEQYRLFFHKDYRHMSLFCVPTGVMGTFSSDVSIRFGLRGPSQMVTTGCTSSTDAMGYSMRLIQSGRADTVLTGGADAPIALGIMKGFILMKILTDSWNAAPEKGSRPFSADRDGFVLAEGAWGAAGVAATIVAMQRGQIPPTINLETPDPACDLDYVPRAGRKASIEHAVCNCIAFGSKNSALVLRKIA